MKTLRIESLEPRVVLFASFGSSSLAYSIRPPQVASPVALEPPTIAVSTAAPGDLPGNIQFRDTSEDFVYSSETIDPQLLDEFIAATDEWHNNFIQTRTFQLDDSYAWFKVINHNPINVHPDGYIISELTAADPDEHTHVTPRHYGDCHTVYGLYTRPDHLYRYSFDIRHPETEETWLTQSAIWSIVTQMWAPSSTGGLNPPFSIYTIGEGNGEASWVIESRGDSRTTTVRPYEEDRQARVPFENLGEWNQFDIEYVPNSQGAGLVRVWINGELAANWTDVKSSYVTTQEGQQTGPLNPQIGLYSFDPEDGQEAHYDHFRMECHGEFQSSISGKVTGAQQLEGNIVYATDLITGERFGVETNRHGLYTLALKKGLYTISASDPLTGNPSTGDQVVSTYNTTSHVFDIDVTPPPTVIHSLSGDVTGDGTADTIDFLSTGQWRVATEGSEDIWGTWDPDTEWEHMTVGDFNGDDLADIVARSPNDGSWHIAESTASSFLSSEWGTWSTATNREFFVGDFNGDGMDDIAGITESENWWIGISSSDQFQLSNWDTPIQWTMYFGAYGFNYYGNASGNLWSGKFGFGRSARQVEWEFFLEDTDGDGAVEINGRPIDDGMSWAFGITSIEFTKSWN